jgi:hypothetical protein
MAVRNAAMTSALRVPINAIHKPDAVNYSGRGRGKRGGIDD